MLFLSDKFFLRFVAILIILFFLGGAAMAAVSAIPYDLIKSKMDLLAGGGSSTLFTADLYGQICLRLRFFGGAAVLFALFLYVMKKRTALYFRAVADSAGGLMKAIKKYPLRQALRREAVYHTALIILIAVAALVRIYFLDQPIKFDEAGSYLYSSGRPFFMIATYYACLLYTSRCV